jgi:hypothetical protein
MGTVLVRKNRFAFAADFINLNLANTTTSVAKISGPLPIPPISLSTTAQAQLVETLVTADLRYTTYHQNNTYFDFLAGVRENYVSANANLQVTDTTTGAVLNRSASRRKTYGTFVLGFAGEIGAGKKFGVPFYFDAGPGPIFSMQGVLGVRYGNLSLVWRHLQYNDPDPNDLIQTVNLDGPALAYRFRL